MFALFYERVGFAPRVVHFGYGGTTGTGSVVEAWFGVAVPFAHWLSGA